MLHPSVNSTRSSKTATDWGAHEDKRLSKETVHRWHHSVDKKHTFLHVKFEEGYIISFIRNPMSNKR
jgi:hypothetical protein